MVAAGITGTDWIRTTQRHCSSLHRPEQNTLATAVTTTTGTTFTFTGGLGGITSQAQIEVDTELCYVQSVNPAALSATVIRGSEGSVAATHLAGATVTVNPRFPAFACFTALNDVLRDLSGSNLFQMKAVTITADTSKVGYDLLATDPIDVYDIRIKRTGSQAMWDRVDNWTLQRNMDPAEFASTNALLLFGMPASNGQPMRVRYKAAFDSVVDVDDDVSITGLPPSSYDLPPIGAAIRLLMGREVKRNFTESQPDTRRAQEVPPGAVLNSMRGLQQMFDSRFRSEVKGLLAAYPPLTRVYAQHPFGTR